MVLSYTEMHVGMYACDRCLNSHNPSYHRRKQTTTVRPLRSKSKFQHNKFVFNLFPPYLNVRGQGCGQIWKHGIPSSWGTLSFVHHLISKRKMGSRWAAVVYLWILPACSLLLSLGALPLPTMGLRREVGRKELFPRLWKKRTSLRPGESPSSELHFYVEATGHVWLLSTWDVAGLNWDVLGR